MADVARTPATPDGNPHLADAAPEPAQPAVVRREDYRPYPWLVPTTRLDFVLGLEETIVTATLTVEPNPAADTSPILHLNGEGLEPLMVGVDGAPFDDHALKDGDLRLRLSAEPHEVRIRTRIDPSANTQLMGLFASGGMLCTQCEAEGFRRIAFFPDRPDVLSTYTVHMEAPRDAFPVLLSNGNRIAEGGDGETHWAEWHDPWPKPSYLFALVAGDLVARSDKFTTRSGREVALNIWVRDGDQDRTLHAMQSLKRAMAWDEATFGREYDLDLYNIVAVSDFNMGAMENKGLNVFNTKYVLADAQTATDGDFDAVEGVIAHEYFHNWSGNRVTCRDWFQLSLKEGFTVLRDQLFSQDMQGPAVKRIEDVRVLRAVQFPEDSGPLAHPIRPDSYSEISNFYTSTVYNKGAEVIRMMRTMAGEDAFRAGCDLYFERHDGEAATCEDFIVAIEEGAELDLTRFRRWYEQAGTPQVTVRQAQEGDTAVIELAQTVPPTPGQPDKAPMPIPLRLALFDRETGAHGDEELVVLEDERATLRYEGFASPPVLSLNRGFSAPVTIERATDEDDLAFLARNDDDPFARYEAMHDLATRHIVGTVEGEARHPAALVAALESALKDAALDDSMRGELMLLPPVATLMERFDRADPVAIHDAREALKRALGEGLRDELETVHARTDKTPPVLDAAAKGARKVRTQALMLLAAADPQASATRAAKQYDAATTMTDRQGALLVLAGIEGSAARTDRLIDFHRRFAGNDLVIDKWFAIQAGSLHPAVIDHVAALADHGDFTLSNPNRVRSLYMAFAANAHGFHAEEGRGYRMIADLILKLDPINAQTAARFVTPLGRWRRIEPARAAMMRGELERIAEAPVLSRDTREQVMRSLGDG